MLILRPRLPQCKMRWDGVANQPHINMAYPPHWDTDLFYSGKRTLGGRMSNSVRTNTGGGIHPDQTHLTPTFGLLHRREAEPRIDNDVTSLHYGHPKPLDATDAQDASIDHDFTSYDILTAPINREKYAVIVDKMVTLDTLHHGVASKRIENVVIPFNKKIKFGGRKPLATDTTTAAATNMDGGTGTAHLSSNTFNEPLNFENRPIIMFLSLDQKISCQVTGYTTITEC